MFAEAERTVGFQVTAAQRNKLVFIFRNVNTTHDALNVDETVRLNASLVHWDRSDVTTLELCAGGGACLSASIREGFGRYREFDNCRSCRSECCWCLRRCVRVC